MVIWKKEEKMHPLKVVSPPHKCPNKQQSTNKQIKPNQNKDPNFSN